MMHLPWKQRSRVVRICAIAASAMATLFVYAMIGSWLGHRPQPAGAHPQTPHKSETPPPARAASAKPTRPPDAPALSPRNLFVVSLDHFHVDNRRINATQSQPNPAILSDHADSSIPAKSPSLRADQQMQKQILAENLRLQARALHLQSTLLPAPGTAGASPEALIDGRLVQEGDRIASFRVLKIEPQRVIVEREGVVLEITMD